MVRHGVEQGPALTKRATLVLAVVAAFYAVFVPVRIHQFGVLWFAHVGSYFRGQAHTSPVIDSFRPAESRFGYDGQFYLFIAADPARARDYMRRSSGGDESGRRYARIVYPMLARVTALGRAGAMPYSMLAINLLAIGAGTLAFAVWLTRRGASPWFAALYGLWPGMVFAVFRDLSEPLAYCFVALALLVFRRSTWVACALLALACLTRETAIVFPIIGAVAVWAAGRRLPRALAFAAGGILPMIVWRLVVTAWLHVTTLESAGGLVTLIPFYGIGSRWPLDDQLRLVVLAAYLPLLAAGVGAFRLLRRRGDVLAAMTLLLNLALFVVFIPRAITIDFGAAYRNATPALIGVLCCLPAWHSRRLTASLGAFLSPVWFIIAGAAVGAHPLALVVS